MINKLIVAGCKEAIEKMKIELLNECSISKNETNGINNFKVINEKSIKKI